MEIDCKATVNQQSSKGPKKPEDLLPKEGKEHAENSQQNDKYAEVLCQEVKWLRMEDIEEYYDTILLRTKMGDMGKYYIIFQSYSRICNSLLIYLPTFEIHQWTKNTLLSYKAALVANASFFTLESAGKSRKHQQQPTKMQK